MLIPKQSVLHFWLTALRHAWANGAPIKLMFQDEARFGRISDVRRCWAPKPVRPLCQAMLTHDYTYAYAAIDVQSVNSILWRCRTSTTTACKESWPRKFAQCDRCLLAEAMIRLVF